MRNRNYFSGVLFFALLFSFSFGSSAQTIGAPEVNGNLCPGSNVTLNFMVKNDSQGWFFPRSDHPFTTETIYTIAIASSTNSFTLPSFTSPIAPEMEGWLFPRHVAGAEATITKEFTIPSYFASDAYTIQIYSDNNDTSSPVTTVYLGLASPNVQNNGPVGIGGSIQLSASTIPGADYLWTGPNGFSSTEQNPQIPNASTAMAGEYNVTVSLNGCSSTPVSTTVEIGGISITDQPADQTVCHGASATFFVDAGGTNLTYQWQTKGQWDYGWSNIYDGDIYSGSSTLSLTISQVNFYNGTSQYRVIISDHSRTLTSNSTYLFVTEGPGWVNQHPDGNSICAGENVTFTAQSSENILQWQVSSDGGTSWTNLKNDAIYSGVTTNNLEIKKASTALNNNFYRVEASKNSCSIYANPSKLTVNALPEIISHPKNQWVHIGQDAIFQAAAMSSNITYTWQAKAGGQWGHWYDINDTDYNGYYLGTTTNKLTVTSVEPWQNEYSFRLKVTNNFGCIVYSEGAILNGESGPCATNNVISYGETRTVSGTANENGVLTMTAPAGTVFTSVNFASYGLPSGTPSNYTYGSCHASSSHSVVEDFLLGKNSASIPATNEVFGDPCVNTVKRLYITATYAVPTEPVCGGTDIELISGKLPQGVAEFTYLWESSTLSPNEGFSPAPGINDTKDYDPGQLFETTWFRRSVITDTCMPSASNVLEFEVKPLPTAEITIPETTCPGEDVYITGSLTGEGPWQVMVRQNEGTPISLEIVNREFTQVLPKITNNTTVEVLSITDASGCTNTESFSFDVTVFQEMEWTGSTSSDWNTASNWSCNYIPTIDTDVNIPGNLNRYPVLSNGVHGLAKDVSIAAGGRLEVSGNTLEIAGVIVSKGILNSQNGSIAFVGSSGQTIPTNAFENNRIQDLIVNNLGGVRLAGNIEVTGFVRVDVGALDAGKYLTLISDAKQTALIDGSGNGSISGSINMQRYLDPAFGYKYFSSPFNNTRVGDLGTFINLNESFPNFYEYDENRTNASKDVTGWVPYTKTGNTVEPMHGYALNFGNSLKPRTVEFSGVLNDGPLSITLYNHHREFTKGFNLVGNPYPSPIDWKAAGWTKTNIDDAIYFFTAGDTDRYSGTYSSYVNGISSADGKSSNIIPSMQGFFVHVSNGTNTNAPVTGILGVTNQVRVNDFSQQFLKSSKLQSVPLIRITAGWKENPVQDPVVIYFNSFAKTSFDKDLDALKMMNTDTNVPNIYSLTPEGEKLSISAIPNPESAEIDRVPLGVVAERDGTMSISLKSMENIPSGSYLYLLDQERNIIQDLERAPEYSFSITKGQHDSRFYLLFSEEKITDPAVAFEEPFSVETTKGRVLVKMNLEQGQKGQLQANSLSGQVIEFQEVAGKEVVEIRGIQSAGIYFISLHSKDNKPFTKKVLVKK